MVIMVSVTVVRFYLVLQFGNCPSVVSRNINCGMNSCNRSSCKPQHCSKICPAVQLLTGVNYSLCSLINHDYVNEFELLLVF